MKVDRFTKAVLTIIAVCLVLLTLKEYDIISDAEAQGVTDVNIKQINGKSIQNSPTRHGMYNGLPVVIYTPLKTKIGSVAWPLSQGGQGQLRVEVMR